MEYIAYGLMYLKIIRMVYETTWVWDVAVFDMGDDEVVDDLL
jgi:hypothetical protein